MHQKLFSGLQPTTHEDIGPYGKERLAQRRRAIHAHACGHRQRMICLRHGVFRISATGQQRRHRIAHSPAGHTFAHSRHMPGRLQPRQGRGIGGRRIIARALQRIGPVHTRIGDTDQDLAGTRLRHRSRRGLEHLGPTVRGDFDNGHAGGDLHLGHFRNVMSKDDSAAGGRRCR